MLVGGHIEDEGNPNGAPLLSGGSDAVVTIDQENPADDVSPLGAGEAAGRGLISPSFGWILAFGVLGCLIALIIVNNQLEAGSRSLVHVKGGSGPGGEMLDLMATFGPFALLGFGVGGIAGGSVKAAKDGCTSSEGPDISDAMP